MPTVLVIDDDLQFLNAAEEMLAGSGYDVLRAEDGHQAVRMLEQHRAKIDLTVIDLALPGINGFELIGALSRRPSPVKMIATTGIYKDSQLEIAGALGAHAVIRKPPAGQPLPEREWLATVRQLVGSPVREQHASTGGARNPDPNQEPPNGNATHC